MALALLVILAPLSSHAATRMLSDASGGPVVWETWGSRAMQRAKSEKRPIFLFVAYASSFDAFRMHRETFLVGEIAETLNSYFIPTLLDRLEYPEVAQTYETIARSMNGASGPPVILVLTPSLEPFAATGPVPPSELSRFLVINANRWAHERDAVTAEAHRNVLKARASAEKSATFDAIQFSNRLRVKDMSVRDELFKLAQTSMRDQLGGGFHHGPRFEKLLSDQALFAIAYLEAFQITHDPAMEAVARSTLDATLRDLHPQNGAFQASQDAHNLVPAQGPEFWNGAFYIWEKDEVAHLLGYDVAGKIFRLYGMREGARNVLTIEQPDLLKDPEVVAGLAKMLDVRQKRPQPFRESNLISGLNGLMISALARAGAVLGEKKYVDAATFAAQFVTKSLWNAPKKTLLHSEGVDATVDDYSLLVQAYLDLFEATYDTRWLDLATALQKRQDELFWNATAGRYATGMSVPEVLRGVLVENDADTPSANSVAAMNLLRLAMITGNATWRDRPAILFKTFGDPFGLAREMPKVYVVTGDPRKKETVDLLHSIHAVWEPLRFVIFVPNKGPAHDRIVAALPFTGALAIDPEHPLAYECSNGECRHR